MMEHTQKTEKLMKEIIIIETFIIVALRTIAKGGAMTGALAMCLFSHIFYYVDPEPFRRWKKQLQRRATKEEVKFQMLSMIAVAHTLVLGLMIYQLFIWPNLQT